MKTRELNHFQTKAKKIDFNMRATLLATVDGHGGITVDVFGDDESIGSIMMYIYNTIKAQVDAGNIVLEEEKEGGVQ